MNYTKRILIAVLAATWSVTGNAQNPVIQTHFTADPAPMVYNGKVYLYTSHDEDSTVNNFFTMYDWRCYSSADMVNWTDHGAVASLTDLNWQDKTNGAWAPHCIERDGMFYLYVPIHGEGISVLVSDSPTGPFSDPLGNRLIVNSDNIWHDIDPAAYIDDDGQAYLYWGNPALYYVKLNRDMISYDRSIGKNGIVAVDMTAEAFGDTGISDEKGDRDEHQGNTQQPGTLYTEGPWLFRENNLYYMVYAAAGIPEYIAYSTAPTAEGPWTYQGIIMERAPHLAFTNHAGIINFMGNAYFFYHTAELSGGEGFRRSVSVEQFAYSADGSIPLISPTKKGVERSVRNLDPLHKNEAETIAWSEGLRTSSGSNGGLYVSSIDHGDYIKIRSVDFRKGAKKFRAQTASGSKGGRIEIRIDGLQGKLLGVCKVNNTGCWQNWKTTDCKVRQIDGVHDLYLVFRGGEGALFNFDWWEFSSK